MYYSLALLSEIIRLTEYNGSSPENPDVPILDEQCFINEKSVNGISRTAKYTKSTGLRGACCSFKDSLSVGR